MKKFAVLLTFFVLVAALLGACTRSAAGALPPTPTAGGLPANIPTGVANAAATQTAVVALPPQTGGGEGGVTPTPVPLQAPTQAPQPTAKPTARPTAKPTAKPSRPTPKPNPVATSVPAQYTLHQGEFPYCLARRFNVDPDVLLSVNGLSRNQQVFPGTTLTIPRSAGPFPYQRALRPHPTTYLVQFGDTFYSIACLFGDVWPEAIAAANGMSVNAPLTPGQALKIP